MSAPTPTALLTVELLACNAKAPLAVLLIPVVFGSNEADVVDGNRAVPAQLMMANQKLLGGGRVADGLPSTAHPNAKLNANSVSELKQ